jgi:hypothetical protein
VERLIGTARRECLDRMLPFGEHTCDEFFLLIQSGAHTFKDTPAA